METTRTRLLTRVPPSATYLAPSRISMSNGTTYSTTINADGSTWSVNVAGSDLAADTEFDATVTGTDDAGNPFSATTTSTHTANLAPPEANDDNLFHWALLRDEVEKDVEIARNSEVEK